MKSYILNDVVSKFGRHVDQTSTPPVSKFGLIDDDRSNQTIAYSLRTNNEYFICLDKHS